MALTAGLLVGMNVATATPATAVPQNVSASDIEPGAPGAVDVPFTVNMKNTNAGRGLVVYNGAGVYGSAGAWPQAIDAQGNRIPGFTDKFQETAGTQDTISVLDLIWDGTHFVYANDSVAISSGDFWSNTPIIRVAADGTFDQEFHDNIQDSFQSLSLTLGPRGQTVTWDGSGYLLGGGFLSTKGVGALIRLNSDGTVDTEFSDNLPALDSSASAMTYYPAYTVGDQSYPAGYMVGGFFTKGGADGTARTDRFLRLDTDGNQDMAFQGVLNNSHGDTPALNSRSYSIVFTGEYFLVGGAFNTSAVQYLMKLHPIGVPIRMTVDGAALNGAVWDLAWDGTGVLVSGNFTNATDLNKNGVLRLKLTNPDNVNSNLVPDNDFNDNIPPLNGSGGGGATWDGSGYVVLGGFASTDPDYDFILGRMRLLGNNPLPVPEKPKVYVTGPGKLAVVVEAVDHEPAPTSYTIYGGPGDLECTQDAGPPRIFCEFPGLDATQEYTFTAVANYPLGTSGHSEPSAAVFPTTPGTPGKPTVEVTGPGAVSVTVDPSSTGGPADSYTVTAGPGGESCTVEASENPLACQITGLDEATEYTFTVTATNGAGTSEASAASDPVQPGPPTSPAKPTVVPGAADNQVKVKINPAEHPGSVDQYISSVVGDPDLSCTVLATDDPLECTIEGITGSDPVQIETVAVQHPNLRSPPSTPSALIIPSNSPLAAPGVPVVTPGPESGGVVAQITPATTPGPVTRYQVRVVDGDESQSCFVEEISAQMSCAITGLDPNQQYRFEAIAFNGDEPSTPSNQTGPIFPDVTSLAKPQAPVVQPGDSNGEVRVTARPATENPGPVVDYVTRVVGDSSKSCRVDVGQDPLSCVIDGLNASQVYQFETVARNGGQESEPSDPSSRIVPNTADPATPQAPSVVPGPGDGTLTATVNPAQNPGPVAQYELRVKDGTPEQSCTVYLPASPLTCQIDGLDPNGEYDLEAVAVNGDNMSDPSAPSPKVIPRDQELSKPQAPVVSPGPDNGKVQVTVEPAEDPGPVVDYITQVKGDPSKFCVVLPAAQPLTCEIAGLDPDTAYEFETVARNGSEESEPSDASGPVYPDTTPPSVPQAPTALAGPTEGEATVTVTPADTPGPVGQYRIEVEGDPTKYCYVAASSSPTSCVVTGLDPNSPYNFVTKAVNGTNESGNSEASERVITPSKPPAPQTATVVPGDDNGEIKVTVNHADDPGVVSEYEVRVVGDPSKSCRVAANADPLECVIDGLSPATKYQVETVAFNDLIASDPSGKSVRVIPSATPLGTPKAPGVNAGANEGEVIATVNPADVPGPVTRYQLRVKGGTDQQFCEVTNLSVLPLSCTIAGLDPSVAYQIETVAFNGDKDSTVSPASQWVLPINGGLAKPNAPVVTPGPDNGKVSITTIPTEDAGPVAEYVTRVKGDPSLFCVVSADVNQLTCEIDGLDPNTAYEFETVARNGSNISLPSDPSGPVYPSTNSVQTPSTPTAVAGPSEGEVTVTVTPADTPGPVGQYRVEVEGDPDQYCYVAASASPLSCVMTGLNPNDPYKFVTKAVNGPNESGNSDPSDPAITPAKPEAPKQPTVVAGPNDGELSITVNPADDPANVTRYRAQVKGDPSKFCDVTDLAGALECVIDGLDKSTPYEIEVVAFNGGNPANGGGIASDPSRSSGPVLPDAVVNLATPKPPTVVAGPNQGEVTLTANPADAPTGPVGEYVIQDVNDPNRFCIVAATANPLSCVIVGLEPGDTYQFETVARNGSATSEPSGPSALVIPNPAALAKPNAPVVTDIDSGGVIEFSLTPTDNPGPVAWYRIQVKDDPATSCWFESSASELSCSITGLDPGTAYEFETVAFNGSDASVPSDSSGPVFPDMNAVAVPETPTAVAGPSEGEATVTVTPADTPGPVGQYRVEVEGDPDQYCYVAASASPLSCVMTGLNPNDPYKFVTKAVNGSNESGNSDASDPAITPAKPAAPKVPSVTPGDGSATVTINPAEDSANVTWYRVQVKGDSDKYCDVTDLSSLPLTCDVTGLTPPTTPIQFEVIAFNGGSPAGGGIASDPSAPSGPILPVDDAITAKPKAPAAAPGPNQGEVTLTANPADAPTGPVGEYVIQDANDPNTYCVVAATANPLNCVITGLSETNPMTFVTIARNGSNESPESDASVPVIANGDALAKPHAPTVTPGPGSGEVNVTVNPADQTGPVAQYVVQVKGDPATFCLVDTSASPLACAITGLSPDTAYEFEVIARNGSEQSDASDSSGAVFPIAGALAKPDAPTATPGPANGQATITVNEAATPGPVGQYRLEVDGDSSKFCIVQADASPLTCVIDGLTPNAEYQFVAIALNGSDSSDPSDSSHPAITPQGPSVPNAPGVEGGPTSGQVTVTVNPAADPGATTKYRQQVVGDSGKFCEVLATATPLSCVITGLPVSASVTIETLAYNQGIASDPSAPSTLVLPVGGDLVVPQAPHGQSNAIGEVDVTVVPAAEPGPVAQYRLEVQGDPSKFCYVASNASPLTCTIVDLIPAVEYRFVATAVNGDDEAGPSAPSQPVMPVPGTPATPLAPTITPGPSAGSVSVVPNPATTPGTVSQYFTYVDGDPTKFCLVAVGASPFSCEISGLQPDLAYQFVTEALNGSVSSLPSDPSGLVRPDSGSLAKPAAPTALAGPANGEATVTAHPAATPGPVGQYRIEVVGDDSKFCVVPATNTPLTCVVSGLEPGQTYQFHTIALNGTVQSEISDASSPALDAQAPSQPKKPQVVAGPVDGEVAVTVVPADDPGTVTKYRVQVVGDPSKFCEIALPASSPLTCGVSGLDPNTAYEFETVAFNDLITSDPSEPGGPVYPTVSVTLAKPDAPTGIPGPQEGQVSVTAVPAADPGLVGEYVNQVVGDPSKFCTVAATASPLTCVVPGLDPSTSYEFETVARNGSTNSEPSNPSTVAVRPSVPAVPKAPTVALGANDGEVSVTVNPANTPGVVTKYRVQVVGDPSKFCDVDLPAASPFTCLVAGLDSNVAYKFETVAFNGLIASHPSPASALIKPDHADLAKPKAPTVVPGSSDGVAKVTVNPADVPGAVADYVVRVKGGAQDQTCTVVASASPLECEITGLNPDTEYEFEVVARNGSSSSPVSDPSAALLPSTQGLVKPNAPTVAVGPANGQLTATVNPAATPGPVTRYKVQVEGDPSKFCIVDPQAAELTCAITGLDQNTAYKLITIAFNGDLASEPSDPANAMKPNTGAVAQPNAPTAVAGPDQGAVTITVNPAASPGPVGQYRVEVVGDTDRFCLVAPGSSPLSCVIDGLDPSDSYTFQTVAINGSETATSGPSAAVVPAKPAAPKAPGVTPGPANGQIKVVINPADDPGLVTKYIARVKNGGKSQFCEVTDLQPAELTCAIPGLNPGTAYEIETVAVNGTINSDPSVPSTLVKPNPDELAKPKPPTVVVGPGTDKVSVTAVPAASPGPVAEYRIQTVGDESKFCVVAASASPRTCVIKGLEPGQDYSFVTIALNGSSASEPSEPSSTVNPMAPIQPNPPTVLPGPNAGQAQVTVEPVSGSEDVTKYRVEVVGDPSRFCEITDLSTSPLTCVIPGIDPDEPVQFQTVAFNEELASSPSDPTAPVDLSRPARPSAPSPQAGPGTDKATVKVNPASNPGPVDKYRVQVVGDESKFCEVDPGVSELTCEVAGLTEGESYQFETIAYNGLIASVISPPSASITIKVPAQPNAPTALAGPQPGQARVTVVPAADPGSVTKYVIQVDGDPSKTCEVTDPTASELTCTITGLNPNEDYEFVAIAHNGLISSDPSDPSNSVQPSQPAQPKTPIVSPGENSGEVVAVVEPADSPGEVSKYRVQVVGDESKFCEVDLPAAELTCTITGLDNSQPVQLEVVAVNDLIVSDTSSSSKPVVPSNTPLSKPTAPSVSPGPSTGQVTAEVDPNPGSEPVTRYLVRVKDGASGESCQITDLSASPLTCVISGLDPNTAVELETIAYNGDSASEESNESEPVVPNVPPGTPGRPIVFHDGLGKVRVEVVPSTTGGVPASYTITATPGGKKCTISASKVPLVCVFVGLNPSTSYTFKVEAGNNVGRSPQSAASAAIRPIETRISKPRKPRKLKVGLLKV